MSLPDDMPAVISRVRRYRTLTAAGATQPTVLLRIYGDEQPQFLRDLDLLLDAIEGGRWEPFAGLGGYMGGGRQRWVGPWQPREFPQHPDHSSAPIDGRVPAEAAFDATQDALLFGDGWIRLRRMSDGDIRTERVPPSAVCLVCACDVNLSDCPVHATGPRHDT